MGYAVSTGVGLTGGTGSGATLDIATVAPDDGALGERDSVAADVEIVKGGSGNDVLNAYAITTTDVVLMGGPGDDILTGGAGNDDLCGRPGNDKLVDNLGDDNLVGGAGSDTADYSAGIGDVVCLGPLDQAKGMPCASQNGASRRERRHQRHFAHEGLPACQADHRLRRNASRGSRRTSSDAGWSDDDRR